jgi:molybdate transport system substrate-binding protein
MAAAISVGRVTDGRQQRFATNELALIIPASNPAGLRTLSDLARPGLKLVLAAPEVPAGHYADLLLDAAAADPGFGPIFRDSVLANVVSYEENVRAVLSKVRLGEADAGIVYRSDVKPDLAGEVGQLTIPQHLNVQAAYIIAPLANSQSPALARDFLEFIISPEGQQLLAANGLQSIAAE